jgi:hypothetical protein
MIGQEPVAYRDIPYATRQLSAGLASSYIDELQKDSNSKKTVLEIEYIMTYCGLECMIYNT